MSRFTKVITALVLAFGLAATTRSQCQSIICTDSSFQLLAFNLHNPNDGSAIGGQMPSNYGYTHDGSSVSPTAIQYYVEGGPYATMMAYVHRPLLYGTKVALDFDLYTTPRVSDLQIIETDSMFVTSDGYLGNGSVQLNLVEGGQLQIVNSSGPWIDIPGAKPGIPAPGKHHYTVQYSWSATAHTFSVSSITFDGVTYTVPATMQNTVMKASTWASGVSFQLQLTLNKNPAHNSVAFLADNAVYTWTAQ